MPEAGGGVGLNAKIAMRSASTAARSTAIRISWSASVFFTATSRTLGPAPRRADRGILPPTLELLLNGGGY
jgi:hypothetical protein